MIYLNGRLTPRAEVCLDPADRGLLLGDGLFETLPSHGGKPVRLAAHLARLEAAQARDRVPLRRRGAYRAAR